MTIVHSPHTGLLHARLGHSSCTGKGLALHKQSTAAALCVYMRKQSCNGGNTPVLQVVCMQNEQIDQMHSSMLHPEHCCPGSRIWSSLLRLPIFIFIYYMETGDDDILSLVKPEAPVHRTA